MTKRLAALAVCAVLAACSGGVDEPAGEPEDVVRAWSRALNAGDNETAADLFAIGARIEQGSFRLTVRKRADAVGWNASLPCSGKIVGVEREGDELAATFELFDRLTRRCDAPGGRVTAVFRVRDGKIVLFRQLGADPLPVDPV